MGIILKLTITRQRRVHYCVYFRAGFHSNVGICDIGLCEEQRLIHLSMSASESLSGKKLTFQGIGSAIKERKSYSKKLLKIMYCAS